MKKSQGDFWNVTNGITKRNEANSAQFDTVDHKALATILLSVKPAQMINVKNCKTDNVCWSKLEQLYKHNGSGRNVTLFKQLVHARVMENWSMSDHIDSFTESNEQLSE